MVKHILMTSEDCDCGGKTDRCPVCDWGLGQCKVCGKAEIELIDTPECPGCAEPAWGERIDQGTVRFTGNPQHYHRWLQVCKTCDIKEYKDEPISRDIKNQEKKRVTSD